MPEATKFCFHCGQQNNLSAQFCQKCGAKYEGAPPPLASEVSVRNPGLWVFIGLLGLFFGGLLIIWSPRPTAPVATAKPMLTLSPTPTISAERMVLDNAQVTAYVECVDREYKRYKIRFIIKRPGSSLIAPILRQIGNPKTYSLFVNGVDTGDDFAFSPNMAAFDQNGELISTDFVSRPLNGDVKLGLAYHDLIVKYENK
jgi:hypothetical protein